MSSKVHSYAWERALSELGGWTYVCGHCGTKVAPRFGLRGAMWVEDYDTGNSAWIVICPACDRPTFIDESGPQIPSVRVGKDVEGVPDDGLRQLYDEARVCATAGAYTACTMVCRKILMNLAVRDGAAEGLNFVEYVSFLEKKGYVPPKGRTWVDAIRQKGNEANHQIALMSKEDAMQVLKFVEALLLFNFELTP